MRIETVQIVRGIVCGATRNGTSQTRYQGYTSGPQRTAVAIGHAHACGDAGESLRRAQTATARPAATAKPAAAVEPASDATPEKIGPLKRKRSITSGTDPSGRRWRSQKGR